jgi:hypothetical protein
VAGDDKLRSELLLRKLLTSLNASSSSRPQFDVVSYCVVDVVMRSSLLCRPA